MLFRASLTNENHQSIFCRTITQISSINKELSVCVTPTKVIISSRNGMFTSICKVEFDKSFFQEYYFDLNKLEVGLEGLKEQTYGFKISSLSLLFKNINFKPGTTSSLTGGKHADGSDERTYGHHANGSASGSTNSGLEALILQVDNTFDCPDEHINKLMVTMKTKNNITKEYLPNIIPCQFEYITLERNYKLQFLRTYGSNESVDIRLKSLFLNISDKYSTLDREFFSEYDDAADNEEAGFGGLGDEQGDLEVNYIKCLLIIWKKFIDSLNTSNVEEIKIDIDRSLLKCEAFTKSIVSQKTNEILKNGMFTMNTIQTKDLENTCLYTGQESVTVRLKDFKMFLNLSNMWSNLKSFEEDEAKSDSSGNGLDTHCLKMWFANNGFPMLLEMNFQKCVQFNLFLITDYKQVVGETVTKEADLELYSIRNKPQKNIHVPLVLSKPGNKLFVQDEDNVEERRIQKKPSEHQNQTHNDDDDVDIMDDFNKSHDQNDEPDYAFDLPLEHVEVEPLSPEPSSTSLPLYTKSNAPETKQHNLKSKHRDVDDSDEEGFKPKWDNPLKGKKRGLANKGIHNELFFTKPDLSDLPLPRSRTHENESDSGREAGYDDDANDTSSPTEDLDNTDMYLHTRHNINPTETGERMRPLKKTKRVSNDTTTVNKRSPTRIEYGSNGIEGTKEDIKEESNQRENKDEKDQQKDQKDEEQKDEQDDEHDGFSLGPTQEQPKLHGLFD